MQPSRYTACVAKLREEPKMIQNVKLHFGELGSLCGPERKLIQEM